MEIWKWLNILSLCCTVLIENLIIQIFHNDLRKIWIYCFRQSWKLWFKIPLQWYNEYWFLYFQIIVIQVFNMWRSARYAQLVAFLDFVSTWTDWEPLRLHIYTGYLIKVVGTKLFLWNTLYLDADLESTIKRTPSLFEVLCA